MFLRRLRQLNFLKLWQLLGFALKSPLAMIRTLKATKQCIRLCDKAYGKSHHLHNRANAVRHALWNLLIIERVAGTKNKQDWALAWTKKITSWHEEFSVNITAEKAMDLHNNKIGRELYVTLGDTTATHMLEYLQEMAKEALQISKPKDIDSAERRLVFISE